MSLQLLDAIQWTFGMTRKEAQAYLRKHKGDKSLLDTILDGYLAHCKGLFWD